MIKNVLAKNSNTLIILQDEENEKGRAKVFEPPTLWSKNRLLIPFEDNEKDERSIGSKIKIATLKNGPAAYLNAEPHMECWMLMKLMYYA